MANKNLDISQILFKSVGNIIFFLPLEVMEITQTICLYYTIETRLVKNQLYSIVSFEHTAVTIEKYNSIILVRYPKRNN